MRDDYGDDDARNYYMAGMMADGGCYCIRHNDFSLAQLLLLSFVMIMNQSEMR